jgi:hypothetical protein
VAGLSPPVGIEDNRFSLARSKIEKFLSHFLNSCYVRSSNEFRLHGAAGSDISSKCVSHTFMNLEGVTFGDWVDSILFYCRERGFMVKSCLEVCFLPRGRRL